MEQEDVRRYFHLLGSYLTMAERIDDCVAEDREFYQDICLLLATKMKDAQEKVVYSECAPCNNKKTFICFELESK